MIGTTALVAACGSGVEVDRRGIASATVDGKTGYSPGAVRVEQGNRVVLTVNNHTDRVHGFSIEGYDVRREVQPNRPVILNLRADKAGTFRIFCQLHDTHQGAQLVVR